MNKRVFQELSTVTDIPVREAPEGYPPDEMRRMDADKPLCLSILAQR